MKRLNIFVDETGIFENNTSELYGVSFVFHEQSNSIIKDVNYLNDILLNIGYSGVIHIAPLVRMDDEYKYFSKEKRMQIFNAIYKFARKVNAKYYSIILNKKYNKYDNDLFRKELFSKIRELFENNISYFNKFDSIVLYYDNGQEGLSLILNDILSTFFNYKQISKFDKKEKKLFQVADMLTFVDKLEYKLNNNIQFNNSEKIFFSYKKIKEIIKTLGAKRFNH